MVPEDDDEGDQEATLFEKFQRARPVELRHAEVGKNQVECWIEFGQ
jgi:hypothetical protein